jgi:pimeloyl-ACP methyl ester carboxylesterase
MTIHSIKGAAGIDLCVEETGNPNGQPVLFIHGFSQSRLAWTRQMRSDLDDLRLVAMDLRGHGDSERPHGAYGEPSLWGDDVHAVITELGLERPILCGWSYGGVVIGDYLSSHGPESLGGIMLVCAVSRMGASLQPFLGPDFQACFPALFATDVETSSTALQNFVRICTAAELEPEQFYTVLGYSSAVPPYVRQEMLSRTVEYDELYATVRLPVMITHGSVDRVVLPEMSRHLATLMPDARTSYYAGVGHAPFVEDPERFNTELREFARTVREDARPVAPSAAHLR